MHHAHFPLRFAAQRGIRLARIVPSEPGAPNIRGGPISRSATFALLALLAAGVIGLSASHLAAQGLGVPGANLPPGKTPEQGYVPEGWYPHEGGLLRYRVAIRFGIEQNGGTLPAGFTFGRVSAVTHDAQGNVYVFHRGTDHNVAVFDGTGRFLRSFGTGFFGTQHGLRIDREGSIWAVDNGNQQLYKFSNDGTLLRTWGERGVQGTGVNQFGRPTDIAWDSQGNSYISDGYGNSRVVKLDREGNWVKSWGEPGDGPGQFRLPHSIGIDSWDRVYVSDRENNRIQIFDTDGNLLRIWTHLGATQGIFITPGDEMWILTHRNNTENINYDTLAGRLMKIDIETGEILGAMESPGHLLTVAPNGDIFVASLTGNVFRWYPYTQNWPPEEG